MRPSNTERITERLIDVGLRLEALTRVLVSKGILTSDEVTAVHAELTALGRQIDQKAKGTAEGIGILEEVTRPKRSASD